MAERRMLTRKITTSDAFTEMPLSAQALYLHLNMEADDDGFVNSPKRIQKMIGASEDDLKLLILKRFILVFESGVIVIKHWRMHNLLRKDRYSETVYKEEKSMLILDENGAYTECGNHLATTWQPDGNQMATQDRIGKDSIDKYSASDDANALFEKLWKLYPRKKGKSAVKLSTKKKLLKVGEEKLTQAIERYSREVEGKEEQYILMGSTFFNGRYEDYIEEPEVKKNKYGI